MSEKDIAERLRDAYSRTGGNAVGDPFVSQIAREIAAVGRAEPEPAPVEPMDVDTVSDVLAGHISVAHGFDNFSRRAIAAEIIRALDRDRGRHEPARAAAADDTPPTLPDASQYYATDRSGQWHYVNHAGAWQACPPPFSSALSADERASIRNEALEEAAMAFDDLAARASAQIAQNDAYAAATGKDAEPSNRLCRDEIRRQENVAHRIRSLKTKDA